MAADGLTTIRSSHGPSDTMNRLEAEVKAKGMTVLARIDHAAGAAAVGLSLRPTRHELGREVELAVSAMAAALNAVAKSVTTSP